MSVMTNHTSEFKTFLPVDLDSSEYKGLDCQARAVVHLSSMVGKLGVDMSILEITGGHLERADMHTDRTTVEHLVSIKVCGGREVNALVAECTRHDGISPTESWAKLHFSLTTSTSRRWRKPLTTTEVVELSTALEILSA